MNNTFPMHECAYYVNGTKVPGIITNINFDHGEVTYIDKVDDDGLEALKILKGNTISVSPVIET